MPLEQLSDIQRILFLQEFVAEVVIQSTEDEKLKHLIKVERIKRKLVKEPEVNLEPASNIIFNEEFQKSKAIKEVRYPFITRKIPTKINQFIKPLISNQNFSNTKTRTINEVMNEINKIINDKSVQTIECPGAGKNVLVKVRNKINLTKIILNEEEIKNVINYFSDSVRIPVIGGILKASLGNITISAIISDSGSRFIINKNNPYNLIDVSNI